MRDYCELQGLKYPIPTISKYMKELNLSSTFRRKMKYQIYHKGHHIYPNLVQWSFKVEKPNTIWCMDFTYLFIRDGRTTYNCTIIDLYNREVVANRNGNKIDTNLAITAMRNAIHKRYPEAWCPYDNAVMERYFNSLKHECSNHYLFESKAMMDSIRDTYAFNW